MPCARRSTAHAKKLARKVEALQGDLAEAKRAPRVAPLRRGAARRTRTRSRRAPASVTLARSRRTRRNARDRARSRRRRAGQRRALLQARRQGRARAQREIPPRLARASRPSCTRSRCCSSARDPRWSGRRGRGVGARPRARARRRGARSASCPRPCATASARPSWRRRRAPRPRAGATPSRGPPAVAAGAGSARPRPSSQPRRFKTAEGWDVLIGRSNEGNDYLTHHLARPEDYWFHVHGGPRLARRAAPRQGQERAVARQTLEEVAALGRVLLAGPHRRQGAGDRTRRRSTCGSRAGAKAGLGVRGAREDADGAARSSRRKEQMADVVDRRRAARAGQTRRRARVNDRPRKPGSRHDDAPPARSESRGSRVCGYS